MEDLSPYLTGGFAPIASELDVEVSRADVSGEVPRDLAGTYVRNGPNTRYPPRGRYHWFDGDGMLHAARIEDGRVRYTNRWIRTDGYSREEAANGPLWSGVMESVKANPPDAPYKDTANTDILEHGGELLALWWISGRPYVVDPRTLETKGGASFEASLGKTKVASHAKVDPRTGELFFFDYGFRPPFMTYGTVSADGARVKTQPIELGGPRLPHDMAITERFAILMDLPVHYDLAALKQARWSTYFDRNVPARFGVVPRDGSGAVRWFEASPCYVYHAVNAWEEGSKIVMVGCRVDDPLPAPDPRDGQWARMMANLRVTAQLYRWTFDLESGAVTESPLDDRNTEFPTMNRVRLGVRSRYSYNVMIASEPTLLFEGLVKYDCDTGRAESYRFEPGCYGSEAPFAPRIGAVEEDDGYVLSFVQNTRAQTSELLIFDARRFSAGPVARVKMPQRIPHGFHSCFVGG